MPVNKHKSHVFYCFSPIVMLATFIIELSLFIYVLFFRKMSRTVRLSALMLACLANFQLAEYGICEAIGFEPSVWSKIGFIAITLLPPLGIDLVLSVSNRKNKIVYLLYLMAFGWVGVYLFSNVLQGTICGGNYLIFNIPDSYESYFYIYYDVILLASIGLALSLSHREENKNTKRALQALALGYFSFIVPSIIFSQYDDYSGLDSPLPSIMCGFAVLFALVLSLVVIPISSVKKGYR
jgi:hypothetical protein